MIKYENIPIKIEIKNKKYNKTKNIIKYKNNKKLIKIMK